MELLQRIPGIGQITALAFHAEIGDINRVKTFDQFCSYIGLVPYRHRSSDKGYIRELMIPGVK